jgi:hypothetical protein
LLWCRLAFSILAWLPTSFRETCISAAEHRIPINELASGS